MVSSDLVNVYTGLSDPEVIRYYGVSYKTLEETKAQISWYLQVQQEESGLIFAICSPDNLNFYGSCGLYYLKPEHRKAEIGFWLLKDFWGQGIMSESIPMVCRFGFEHFHLNRIESIVESENIACKNLMAKTGFRYEGTMEQAEIKNGRFINLEMYAKLRDQAGRH